MSRYILPNVRKVHSTAKLRLIKIERLEERSLLNAAPTASDDAYSFPADSAFHRAAPGLLQNDSDPDGDAITVFSADDALNGSVAWDPNGGFEYTPNPGFRGVDSFSYKVSDGSTLSAPATAHLRVGNYESLVLADEPLGYWKLGESSSSDPALDASGNELIGRYRDVNLDSPGAIVSEIDTAGVFQNRSHVDLGKRPEFTSLVNNFSIEAWIHPTRLFQHQRIFSNTSNSDRRGFGFGVNNNSLAFTTFRKLDYISQPVLENGNWYHVAVVFDASNDATFFVNGEQVGVIEGEAPPDISNAPAYIGGLYRDESFQGSIDEVAIYDRPLSAESIRNHYLMGSIDSGKTPVAANDVYTIQGGSRFETTVPQLPIPRYSFSDEFSAATLTPNLEDPTGSFRVTGGVLKPQVDRQYVRTVKTDYLSGDFVFEVDVDLTTTKNTIEYVGIGSGERGQVDEPADALYVRLHSVGFNGDIVVTANGPFGGINFGRINRPGTHRVQMTKTGNQLLVEVDAFVDGSMQPDMSYWIGDVAGFAPFLNATNSRLIVGGSTESSFDNLGIVSSLDEGGIPGLLHNDMHDNDLHAGGDVKPVLASGPEHGELELRANGMFTFTPDADFSGVDSFSYFLDDGRNWSNLAKVTLRVNGPPDAVSDSYTVSEDSILDARGPLIDIAQTGFNDQAGMRSDDTPNSPYWLNARIADQGSREENWLKSWEADPNISRVVSDVAFEGDGALHLRQTSNTYRTWNEPQSDVFTVEQHLRFTEDSRTLVGIHDGEDRCCRGNTGPFFGFFPDRTILALKNGNWLTTEATWEPDRWYQLTTLIDVRNQSWRLFVDGVEVLENETLDFRGEPTRLDSINYLSEVSGQGAYVDNLRVFSGNEIPGVLFNDSDSNGDRLGAVLIETTKHGQLTFDADGKFLYEPVSNYSGTDSFTYRAFDAFGQSELTTVTLVVEPSNDAPVARDDEFELGVDRTLSVSSEEGLLRNDVDIDGDILTAILVDSPTHGQLTLNDDGSFLYTANAAALTDQFTYQATDGELTSEARTVKIISHLPMIDVGNFTLLPNTPNQEIEIFVSGGHPVSGLDLFAIIGDGGPERTSLDLDPGIDGPTITNVDLKTGTIFSNVPDAFRDLGSLPQIANWTISIADGGSVTADGRLATITVDTTGFLEGTWDLSLTNLLPEHPFGPFSTTFANWPIAIANGFIAVVPTSVVTRHSFYNNSSWDDDNPQANVADDRAIATDKVALFPGEKAGFSNYTSFSKGITGIMIDIANHSNAGVISLSDFEFRVGRNSNVSTWNLAPQPEMSVRPGEGANGSTRVTFTWPDNAIRQEWLEIRTKTNENTLLPRDDVFYFGNAIGETGNSANESLVTSVDVIGTRDHQRGPFDPALITDVYDFNRDQIVSSIDVILARDHQVGFLTALPLITPEDLRPVAAVAEFVEHNLNPRIVDSFCSGIADANARMDINQDGITNRRDLEVFHDLHGIRFGDRDLNGNFDSRDLVLVFQSGEFEDQQNGNSTWSEGDWDCNADFDSSDLVMAFQYGVFAKEAAKLGKDERIGTLAGASVAGDANSLTNSDASRRQFEMDTKFKGQDGRLLLDQLQAFDAVFQLKHVFEVVRRPGFQSFPDAEKDDDLWMEAT